MRTLNREDYDFINSQNFRIPPDKWPDSIRVLNPPKVDLYADENGNPHVSITWGGGFFHWGVVIGMEDMVVPPWVLKQTDEHWLLVEPGVYVWESG